MQCYTCKGSATNEVDANIRCLASSNLEDCDHFYEYYDMVETDGAPSPPSYEFYDYGPDDNVPVDSGTGKRFSNTVQQLNAPVTGTLHPGTCPVFSQFLK